MSNILSRYKEGIVIEILIWNTPNDDQYGREAKKQDKLEKREKKIHYEVIKSYLKCPFLSTFIL